MNCFICGKKLPSKKIELTNRMLLCQHCFKINNGFRCESCGGFFLGDEYDPELKVCIYCSKGIKSEDENDKKIYIHNYYYKPYPTFFKINDENNLYLGIELEVGGNDDYNNVNKFAANYENDFFYIKKDSSIPKYGCEIVTYPATLEYHKHIENKWKKILNGAKKFNFKSYDIDNCGIHVHINKDYLTVNEIAKLDLFVNKHHELFVKIARRSSKYARFLKKPLYLYGLPINVNRHCALNLCNQNTIEFRIFKGTLSYSSITAIMELVYCLVHFIKQHKLNDMIYRDYSETFINYAKSYNFKHLNNYLDKIL